MEAFVPPRRRGTLADLEREKNPTTVPFHFLLACVSPPPPSYLGPVGHVPEENVSTDFGLLSVLL